MLHHYLPVAVVVNTAATYSQESLPKEYIKCIAFVSMRCFSSVWRDESRCAVRKAAAAAAAARLTCGYEHTMTPARQVSLIRRLRTARTLGPRVFEPLGLLGDWLRYLCRRSEHSARRETMQWFTIHSSVMLASRKITQNNRTKLRKTKCVPTSCYNKHGHCIPICALILFFIELLISKNTANNLCMF